MDLTVNDFYFCYDKKIADYLRYERGIRYITAAKHPTTDNMFYMFVRTPKLKEALDNR